MRLDRQGDVAFCRLTAGSVQSTLEDVRSMEGLDRSARTTGNLRAALTEPENSKRRPEQEASQLKGHDGHRSLHQCGEAHQDDDDIGPLKPVREFPAKYRCDKRCTSEAPCKRRGTNEWDAIAGGEKEGGRA